MTREEAIQILADLIDSPFLYTWEKQNKALHMAIEALSAEATKKKAELKENGDWDCPDVGCDECDHQRSVSWCSLAIPNHEEIDDTYKMVTEAFFEGFESAEKRYRFLIETVEELVSVVRCKDCRFNKHPSNDLCLIKKAGIYPDDDDFCSYGEKEKK